MINLKITLNIDGKKIELTEGQARRLRSELERIFGRYWYWPYYTQEPFYKKWEVPTYSGSTSDNPLPDGITISL
jgi:hypothetical protein